MSRIATGTGDKGETGLASGRRVSKADARIEAYGTVDELNTVIGVAVAGLAPGRERDTLLRIQRELFDVGADLALAKGSPRIGKEHIARLDAELDALEAALPPLKRFVLPGGSASGATLHQARAVCRRAERRIVALANSDLRGDTGEMLVYLNRLSDLLFLLARKVNRDGAQEESEVVFDR